MADRDFTLGQHEADIRTLLDRTDRIEIAVNSINATLSERNGERRTLIRVGALAGAGSTMLFTFIGWLVKEYFHK